MLVPTSRTSSSKKTLKMSLIDKSPNCSTSPMTKTEEKLNINHHELSPMSISHDGDNNNNIGSRSNEFKCTLISPQIEWIAPNEKGNFITAICIDELNGWLLSGQCSGTLNAWKIPTIYNNKKNKNKNKNKNNKVFECRNLIKCEEDGIRHIYQFDDNIICMIGYRRIISFINYNESRMIKKKLGINDIFTYSPFTSPHMFYSTQYQNIIHIFCRSFGSALKIDLKTQKKEILKLINSNKIPSKTNILTVNKNFIIWQSKHTKSNFYVKDENLYKNKQKKERKKNNNNNNNNNNNKNKLTKWLNQYTSKRRKYEEPTLKKIQIRSLQNFNPIHDEDYFEPLSFNSWGFQMDDISMTMAYITNLNIIKIVKITPDFNIMQYGLNYHKNQYQYNNNNKNNKNKNNKPNLKALNHSNPMNSKKDNNNNHNNNSLIDALTLSTGLSYEASAESPSNGSTNNNNIDVLINDNKNNNDNDNNDDNDNDNDDGIIINNSLQREQNTDNKLVELYNLRGHNGYILAIEYSDSIIVSIATDRKLCVWNGKTGKKIAMTTNIPGTFIPGYPYIIKKAKNSKNKIFYTADDGIFMVVF